MFTNFTRSAPISETAISRYAEHVPPEIVQIWREQGAGWVGDGFVRVIDPDRAMTMLDGMLGMPPNSVPVFTTALADVVIYIEPLFHVLRFRYGVIDLLAFDTAGLIRDLEDEQYLDQMLARQPYPAGVARLGVPNLEQCFGYVPLLALGGPEDPAHFDRGGFWEHLAIIMQFAGPPQSRQG